MFKGEPLKLKSKIKVKLFWQY